MQKELHFEFNKIEFSDKTVNEIIENRISKASSEIKIPYIIALKLKKLLCHQIRKEIRQYLI